MHHRAPLPRFVFAALAVLPLALLGCAAHVTGGGGEGGDGTGDESTSTSTSSSSSGSPSTCTEYAGAGCTPGDTQSCETCTVGQMGMIIYGTSTPTCTLVPDETCSTEWAMGDCGCDTPLVLSFDGAPVEFTSDRAHAFDINGTRSQLTDWPTARTPWLARDRDGNGSIDDGAELFGSMTTLASGRRAPNGFAALRELDANGDGRITPADPRFSELLVWADRDGDRMSSASELASAARWELLSIDLDYSSEPRCDARGNCEVERAAFCWRDASGVVHTGAVVDVHLPPQTP